MAELNLNACCGGMNEKRANSWARPSQHRVVRLTLSRIIAFLVLLQVASTQLHADVAQFTLSTAPGGVTISGSKPNYTTSNFGIADGLGVSPPPAGVTVVPTTNGAYFTTPISISTTGNGSEQSNFYAYISTNFGGGAASALSIYICPGSTWCGSPTPLTTTPVVCGGPPYSCTGALVATFPHGSSATAMIGILVPSSGTYAGTASATITLVDQDLNDSNNMTATLTLSNISVQSAVKLWLGSNGGLPITPTDDTDPKAINFGNINGLGLGTPQAGAQVQAYSGYAIYYTPYRIVPSFSGQTSSTGTINACTTNFTNSFLQVLESATAPPLSAVSTNCGSPTLITTAATSNTAIPRYLGIKINQINNGVRGADSATITYTLTVP